MQLLECVSRPRRGRRTHRRMRGCRPARLWVKGVTIVIENHLTASDAGPLAKLHRRAFPGFFLSRLGEPFLRQLYLGFVDDETAVTVVERDARGVPRGVAVGTIDPVGFYSRLLRRRWAGFALASVLAVIRDPRTAPRLVAAVNYRGDAVPGRAGALLSSICVDPALSGTGVGHALLAAWRQRASELGNLQSDEVAGNGPVAQHADEHGLAVVFRGDVLHPRPGLEDVQPSEALDLRPAVTGGRQFLEGVPELSTTRHAGEPVPGRHPRPMLRRESPHVHVRHLPLRGARWIAGASPPPSGAAEAGPARLRSPHRVPSSYAE